MENFDDIDIYCKSLGHRLNFKYCRTMKNGLPCHGLPDCWFERIPVMDFLEKNYTADEIEKSLAPPVNKITSIIDLIEKARKNSGG
ncbi:MAG: hypothetical protein MUD12_00120 [Spirochaetes bacterium]|jgi:hypothetical protein|nr:hypothetical protein [Spirochaetota bacterium]